VRSPVLSFIQFFEMRDKITGFLYTDYNHVVAGFSANLFVNPFELFTYGSA